MLPIILGAFPASPLLILLGAVLLLLLLALVPVAVLPLLLVLIPDKMLVPIPILFPIPMLVPRLVFPAPSNSKLLRSRSCMHAGGADGTIVNILISRLGNTRVKF